VWASSGTARVVEYYFNTGVQFNSVNSHGYNAYDDPGVATDGIPSPSTMTMGGNWAPLMEYNVGASSLDYFWSTQFMLPSTWDSLGPIDVDLIVTVPQEAGPKSARYGVRISCLDATDSYDNSFGTNQETETVQTVTGDTGGEKMRTVSFANLAKTGCEPGDFIGILIHRDGDGSTGTDDMAQNKFLGAKIRYQVAE
jgi:hypothetical protein